MHTRLNNVFCVSIKKLHLSNIWFFSRLKKIQEKKKIIKEKAEKERAAWAKKEGGSVGSEPVNLLAEDRDEDLLFD